MAQRPCGPAGSPTHRVRNRRAHRRQQRGCGAQGHGPGAQGGGQRLIKWERRLSTTLAVRSAHRVRVCRPRQDAPRPPPRRVVRRQAAAGGGRGRRQQQGPCRRCAALWRHPTRRAQGGRGSVRTTYGLGERWAPCCGAPRGSGRHTLRTPRHRFAPLFRTVPRRNVSTRVSGGRRAACSRHPLRGRQQVMDLDVVSELAVPAAEEPRSEPAAGRGEPDGGETATPSGTDAGAAAAAAAADSESECESDDEAAAAGDSPQGPPAGAAKKHKKVRPGRAAWTVWSAVGTHTRVWAAVP